MLLIYLNLYANFIKEWDWVAQKTGSQLGAEINDFWDNLVKGMNMRKAAGSFTKEISDAFNEGVTNLSIKDSMSHTASEFNAGMSVFRENFFNQISLLRSDIQSIFADAARDTTIKIVPWIALGGVILTGTPLITYYLYKKAIHNIGRPKLAQEIRKVGLWDFTKDHVTRAISSIWSSAKLGVKWSILSGSGMALAVTVKSIFESVAGEDG